MYRGNNSAKKNKKNINGNRLKFCMGSRRSRVETYWIVHVQLCACEFFTRTYIRPKNKRVEYRVCCRYDEKRVRSKLKIYQFLPAPLRPRRADFTRAPKRNLVRFLAELPSNTASSRYISRCWDSACRGRIEIKRTRSKRAPEPVKKNVRVLIFSTRAFTYTWIDE